MNIKEEVFISDEEQIETSPSLEMTHILNTSVQDISNKSKSNIMFYTANGCIPGQFPVKKPDITCKPHQSITCSPRKKQVKETPEIQSCEACGKFLF